MKICLKSCFFSDSPKSFKKSLEFEKAEISEFQVDFFFFFFKQQILLVEIYSYLF